MSTHRILALLALALGTAALSACAPMMGSGPAASTPQAGYYYDPNPGQPNLHNQDGEPDHYGDQMQDRPASEASGTHR